jgi:small conductance mechanosensitive channel
VEKIPPDLLKINPDCGMLFSQCCLILLITMRVKLEQLYDRMLNWLIAYGPRILIALIVLLLGFWIIRVINKLLVKRMDKSRLNPSLKYFFLNFVVIAAQILLVVLGLQIAGIQMTFFTAIIAGLTVAVGLALSGTLQNFTSGILILLLKPYRVGDNIVTQGQAGTVTSIQLFSTIVLTFDNTTVIAPNSKLSNEIIINLTRSGKRRLDIELKFPYTTDIEKLKLLITDTISSFDQALKDQPARVGVSKLEKDGFTVWINAWLPSHHFEDNRLSINERLLKSLHKEGLLNS